MGTGVMCLPVWELRGAPAPGVGGAPGTDSRRASPPELAGEPGLRIVWAASVLHWGVFVPWSHFQKVSHTPHTDSGAEEARPRPRARGSCLGPHGAFSKVLCGLLRTPLLQICGEECQ